MMSGSGRKRKGDQDDDCQLSDSEDNQYPEYISSALEFYEFHSKTPKLVKDGLNNKKRDVYTLKCRLCKDSKKKKPLVDPDAGLVTGNSAYGFKRHLLRVHKTEISASSLAKLQLNHSERYKLKLKRTEGEGTSDSETESITPAIVGITGNSPSTSKPVKKYDEGGVRQTVFNKHVLDWIVLDNKPLNSSSRKGFRQLIHSIDPRLTCQSAQTITRSLTAKFDTIVANIRKTLRGLKPGSAHLILDIWSSRQKLSVIGVQVRFMKNWKLQQFVLGFKHFPGCHDAQNIREKLSSLLKDQYGLTMSDFMTVTADNASAILSAFKEVLSYEAPQAAQSTQSAHMISELDPSVVNNHGTCVDLENEDEKEEEGEEVLLDVELTDGEVDGNIVSNESLNLAIDAVIEQWGKIVAPTERCVRNSCLAHLLQLSIKDALQKNEVTEIIKRVNNIITWFHKSNKFYTIFRSQSKLALVKPCETRWNSTYHCLKRLCREIPCSDDPSKDTNVTVATVVNKVLQDAKKVCKKVPQGLSDDDLSFINVLLQLLEPFANLTDVWQGDGVTSSIVIYGLIDAIKSLEDIKIEGVSDQAELNLLAFKVELKTSVIQRFGTERDGDGVTKGQGRRIVTKDVFNDKFYILATVLDPRLKTVPFEDIFMEGVPFSFPSKDRVVSLLKAAYEAEEKEQVANDKNDIEIISHSLNRTPTSDRESSSLKASNNPTVQSTPGPSTPRFAPLSKKPKKDIFERLQKHQESASAAKADKRHFEVDEYLSAPPISGKESHLKFWKQNEGRFPILSSVASKVLSLPASSASVERLFSVAGAIITQRRTRMKIKTAEMVLLYNDYLRRGSVGVAEDVSDRL